MKFHKKLSSISLGQGQVNKPYACILRVDFYQWSSSKMYMISPDITNYNTIVVCTFLLLFGTSSILLLSMKGTVAITIFTVRTMQGPRAERMMQEAMDRGRWVFFQNCHLSPSWMPTLERLIEQIDGDKVHRDFRLWLTSMPSPKFPVPILQNSSKVSISLKQPMVFHIGYNSSQEHF